HLLPQLLALLGAQLLEVAPLGDDLLAFLWRQPLEGLEVLTHPRLLLGRKRAPAGDVGLDAGLLVEGERLELAEALAQLRFLLLAHPVEARRRVVLLDGLRPRRAHGDQERDEEPRFHGRPSFCSSSRCSTTSRSSCDRPTTS